ncbi:DNA polymerase III subunit psi [Actinobacillus ureae]|uniref:DNA polymerase III subunit psi n=1 Tax=Actinobacillus ureae ATCC 25976 TaxID=887324 RepID=E8KJT0_9PAST|nr:DNA polymerase III subunit psi [Actinobacillus ureae]EFX90858.1 DNA polymerase III subunit psi [Actinobacillus ureae ATCC 25976]SUT87284.1 DNA polymerase III subunit psi [Actinobacillus ureae]SUU48530.1 DNA polymerase III subunit psi [Actinobacillus ureae]
MNRRDLLLNEMNIPQWVLTKPQVLKGDAQIRLDKAVKLVVVCEENHQTSGLFSDILRTLQLQPNQYQWLDAEQAQRLAFEHQPIFWLIQAESQAVEIAKKFANQTAWQHSSWQDLTNVTTKCQLWRQMAAFCQHFGDNHD